MRSDNKEFQRELIGAMKNPVKEDRNCDIHGEYIANLYSFGGSQHESPCPACFDLQLKKEQEEDRERIAAEHKKAKIAAEQRQLEEKNRSGKNT